MKKKRVMLECMCNVHCMMKVSTIWSPATMSLPLGLERQAIAKMASETSNCAVQRLAKKEASSIIAGLPECSRRGSWYRIPSAWTASSCFWCGPIPTRWRRQRKSWWASPFWACWWSWSSPSTRRTWCYCCCLPAPRRRLCSHTWWKTNRPTRAVAAPFQCVSADWR